MRVLLLFMLLAMMHPPVAYAQSVDYSIMTYNIRNLNDQDGENIWQNRRDFLASQILFHAPDVVGVQEAKSKQIEWLLENLSRYDYLGEGRRGEQSGEYSAIFYRRDRVDILQSGTFWLSDTPDIVSKGWDAALPRICTWAEIRNRTSGLKYWVFNTHLDHRGELARAESIKLLAKQIQNSVPANEVVYLMGDLNITPDDPALKPLENLFSDAYHEAEVRLGPVETFNGFQFDYSEVGKRIDYIWFRKNARVKVRTLATLTDAIEKRYPSDHFPIIMHVTQNPRPLIIGHRGAMGHAMENSLASVQAALDMNVDKMEIDVFRLSDGEIVVFHDDDMERLTGKAGDIQDLTLLQLNSIPLLGGHRIPRLQDVMALIDHRVGLNIELKGANTAKATYDIVKKFVDDTGWKWEDIVISSFKHDELRKMRGIDNDIDLEVLPEGDPLEALKVAQEINASGVNAYFRTLNPEVIKAIRDAGFKVNVWTVNEEKDIQEMIQLGVDGIITNYPDRVTKTLDICH